MRPDTAGRVKLVFGLVLALILMVLGMVLITNHPSGPAAHARQGAATISGRAG